MRVTNVSSLANQQARRKQPEGEHKATKKNNEVARREREATYSEGRQDLLSHVQSQFDTAQKELCSTSEELKKKKSEVKDLLNRIKQNDEFRQVYYPLVLDAIKHQMQSYRMTITILESVHDEA